MPSKPVVSDEALARALGIYAGMVGRVLNNPRRWLGVDEDPPITAGWPVRVLDAVRDRALGEVTPASPDWAAHPESKRVDWWLRRIAVGAGLAAAAPRFAGALADRIPLQAALGASAAGLAVCAVARERGTAAPADWVPLLARVLFQRRSNGANGRPGRTAATPPSGTSLCSELHHSSSSSLDSRLPSIPSGIREHSSGCNSATPNSISRLGVRPRREH